MVLNIARLKEAGVTVRIYERNGKGDPKQLQTAPDTFIEVWMENGTPLPDSVTEPIRDMLPDEYGDPVLEKLHERIHTIQVMEAINRTGRARK